MKLCRLVDFIWHEPYRMRCDGIIDITAPWSLRSWYQHRCGSFTG